MYKTVGNYHRLSITYNKDVRAKMGNEESYENQKKCCLPLPPSPPVRQNKRGKELEHIIFSTKLFTENFFSLKGSIKVPKMQNFMLISNQKKGEKVIKKKVLHKSLGFLLHFEKKYKVPTSNSLPLWVLTRWCRGRTKFLIKCHRLFLICLT